MRRGGWQPLLTVEATCLVPECGLLLFPALVELASDRPALDRVVRGWWSDAPRLPLPAPRRVELWLPEGGEEGGGVLRVRCRFLRRERAYRDARCEGPPGFLPPWDVLCCLPTLAAEAVPPGTLVRYAAPGTPDAR